MCIRDSLYAFIGENEKSLDILESNTREKVSEYMFFNVNPVYNNLRSDPRFAELKKKMGFDDN
jgi:hypothetical protein